jgi:ribosomal protein RSM22 (predicted rRNA methylase)
MESVIDREMGKRAIASRRAFKALDAQHKLWVKAYRQVDVANIVKLARERDSKARKALRAYKEADRFFNGITGLWTVYK